MPISLWSARGRLFCPFASTKFNISEKTRRTSNSSATWCATSALIVEAVKGEEGDIFPLSGWQSAALLHATGLRKHSVRREPISSRHHWFSVISSAVVFGSFAVVVHLPCLCFPLRWWVSDYCAPAVNFLEGGENKKGDCARFSFHPFHSGISFKRGWSCLV